MCVIIAILRLSKVPKENDCCWGEGRQGIMITFILYYIVDSFLEACGHLMKKKEPKNSKTQQQEKTSQNKVILR